MSTGSNRALLAAIAFFAGMAAGFSASDSIAPVAGVSAPKLTAAILAKLETDAAAGSADAQLELALAYDDGAAGAVDAAKAVQWYKRAEAHKVGAASLRLGMLSETGSGVEQSYQAARSYYEEAVALGVPEANLRLGILYLEGWGVPRDPQNAESLIAKAANAGYEPAALVLSDMFMAGVGVERSAEKAVEWAKRAADAKDPQGEERLGNLAIDKGALKPDMQLARDWFQLSAEQDYSRGMLWMSSTFLHPGHTAEDEEMAGKWLQLAADNGNSAAAFYLGAHIAMTATSPDDTVAIARAMALLEQSARSGEQLATEVIELTKAGRTLQEAFTQVLTVPFDERYVQRFTEEHLPTGTGPNPDHIPLPTKLVQPVYPQTMRLTGTQGEVLVDFIVDSTGRVRNATVIRSSHPAFSDMALEAVQQWVFIPRMRNGHPVFTHMRVPVRFLLSDIHDGGWKPRADNATASEGTPPAGNEPSQP